jgi:hypothetical protein
MDFKNMSELTKKIREINKLPKVACGRCKRIYRAEKKNFICRTCIKKEREQRAKNRRKEFQIQTLLNLSNSFKSFKHSNQI